MFQLAFSVFHAVYIVVCQCVLKSPYDEIFLLLWQLFMAEKCFDFP